MSRQMQQSLPGHLQQYVGANKPAYVPQRVQQELTAHMQKAMPDHLKQYAGAYVEQNIMSRPASSTPLMGRPPIPDRLNRSHSGDVAAEQANAQFLNMFQSDQPQNTAPAAPPSGPDQQIPSAPPGPTSSYDFIMNPQQSTRPPLFKLGGPSAAVRAAVVAGGLLLLLVLFIGFKSILAGSNKSIPSLVGITQDQQELIHLASNGVKNVTDSHLQAFAITAQVSVQSEQGQLITYLANNHRKVANKELVLKVNKSTDNALTAALAASNYDPIFKQAMQTKLASYKQDLQQAYTQTKGPKGRALLTADYDAASLLLKQLGS